MPRNLPRYVAMLDAIYHFFNVKMSGLVPKLSMSQRYKIATDIMSATIGRGFVIGRRPSAEHHSYWRANSFHWL